MNRIIISAIGIAATVLVSCSGSKTTEGQALDLAAQGGNGASTLVIDTSASSVEWLAKKVTGQHNGIIRITSGELKSESGKPVAGKFEFDMNSIVVKDLTDPAMNAKLTGHLKSDDFFSSANHPKGAFEITSLEAIEGAASGQPNYKVKGNLTLKGISKPVEFPAVIKTEGEVILASGALELDRTLWDIRYGSGKFFQGLGDKMIYDTFNVNFNITAVKG